MIATDHAPDGKLIQQQLVNEAIEEAMSQENQDFAAQELLEMSSSQDAAFFDQQRLSHPINSSCTKLFEEHRLSQGSTENRNKYGYLLSQNAPSKCSFTGLQDTNHVSGWFSHKPHGIQAAFKVKNSRIETSTKSVATTAGTNSLHSNLRTPKVLDKLERPTGNFKLDGRHHHSGLNFSRIPMSTAKYLNPNAPQAEKDFLTSCLDLTNSAFLRSSIESSARKIEYHQAILTRPLQSPKPDRYPERSPPGSPHTHTVNRFTFPLAAPAEPTLSQPKQHQPEQTGVSTLGAAVVLDDFISELRKLAGTAGTGDLLMQGVEGKRGPFIEIGTRPAKVKKRPKELSCLAGGEEGVASVQASPCRKVKHLGGKLPGGLDGQTAGARLPLIGSGDRDGSNKPVETMSFRVGNELVTKSFDGSGGNMQHGSFGRQRKSIDEVANNRGNAVNGGDHSKGSDFEKTRENTRVGTMQRGIDRQEINSLNLRLDGMLKQTQMLKSSNVKNIFKQFNQRKVPDQEPPTIIASQQVGVSQEKNLLSGNKQEQCMDAFRGIQTPLRVQGSELKKINLQPRVVPSRIGSRLQIANKSAKMVASQPDVMNQGVNTVKETSQYKMSNMLELPASRFEEGLKRENSLFRSFEPTSSHLTPISKTSQNTFTPHGSRNQQHFDLRQVKPVTRNQGGYLRTRRLAEILSDNLRIAGGVGQLSSLNPAPKTLEILPLSHTGWSTSKQKSNPLGKYL